MIENGFYISVGLSVAALIVWALRLWVQAFVARTVQAKFDRELESLKSDLRLKETRINGLSDHVLSGAANRYTLLQQKRIEALEDIWANVDTLGAFNQSAKILQILKYDAVASLASSDARIGEMFDTMRGGDLKGKIAELSGERSRIFVTDDLWSTYAAYQSILIQGHLMLEALVHRLPEPRKLFKGEEAVKLAKAILPHQSKFLDENGPDSVFYLVDEIREKLLSQIRKELLGEVEHAQNVTQVAEIMKLVHSMDANEQQFPTTAAQHF